VSDVLRDYDEKVQTTVLRGLRSRLAERDTQIRELQTRVAELESDKRLASDWECADCGRINPGTMPYCPCREEP
jgi:uncharacterized protein HemX